MAPNGEHEQSPYCDSERAQKLLEHFGLTRDEVSEIVEQYEKCEIDTWHAQR